MKPAFLLSLILAGSATALPVQAEEVSCEGEATILASSPEVNECLRYKAYGASKADTLLVWLHGDVSNGGPATYHRTMAERAIQDHPTLSLASVALVRPGYPDDSGLFSDGELHGRLDHYTEANIARVATAIANLKAQFEADDVILIGHSGGAATAANVLGRYPELDVDAILAACPCDLSSWRAYRGWAWPNSLDPINQTAGVQHSAKVIALTAEADDNTLPIFAETYIQQLNTRGVKAAEFRLVTNPEFNSHNGVFRTPELRTALADVLAAQEEESGGETGGENGGETGGGTEQPSTGGENGNDDQDSGGGAPAWPLLLALSAAAGWRRFAVSGKR